MAKGIKYPKLPSFAQRAENRPKPCPMMHFPKLGITLIHLPEGATDADEKEAKAIARRLFGP